MRRFIFLTVFTVLILLENSQGSTILRRETRGLLSRTGLCPNPHINNRIRDNRLNFYGRSYVLPQDDDGKVFKKECEESECMYDSHCRGNQKCCLNTCGANICTEAVRDPHPCSMFTCPRDKICKLQRVRCIFPSCPDLYAVPRPICVPAKLVPFIVSTPKPVTPDARVWLPKRSRLPHVTPGAQKLTDEVYIYPEKPFFRRVQDETRRSQIAHRDPDRPEGVYIYPEKPFFRRGQDETRKSQVAHRDPDRAQGVYIYPEKPFFRRGQDETRRSQIAHRDPDRPQGVHVYPENPFYSREEVETKKSQTARKAFDRLRDVYAGAENSFGKWAQNQTQRSQIAQPTPADPEDVYVSPETPILRLEQLQAKKSQIAHNTPAGAQDIYVYPEEPYFRRREQVQSKRSRSQHNPLAGIDSVYLFPQKPYFRRPG